MKLCILGGGGFRTPFVYQALLGEQADPRIDEVALHDTDERRLTVMTALLRALAEPHAHAPTVTASTELTEAVQDSDFVFAAIRVGGLSGRVCDERVALDNGVLGQETTGAGGLSYALRTVPVMLEAARVIRASAPSAFVLNFTNPAGIITEAMQSVLGERVVGICDTPSGLGRRIADALDLSANEVHPDYIGLNHLGWMRRVLHHGRDVLPDLLADDARLAPLEETELFGADWLRTLGCIPNEYLYYYYANREAVAAIRDARMTRGQFLLDSQTAFYDDAVRVSGNGAGLVELWRRTVRRRSDSYMAEARGAEPGTPDTGRAESDPAEQGYAGVAVAVMTAIAGHERTTAILNVANGTTVAALPADAVIEVPTMVDGNGVRPLVTPAPDAHQLGLMSSVKAVERLVISAARSGSRAEAVEAFALHPLVDSVAVARRLLAGYEQHIPEVRAVFGR